ncbi:mannosyltransferase, partial [Podochytrium sp. JEL0797]
MKYWPVFLLILAARLLGAFYYTVIADCDEVFNYWDPTHFLDHGVAFETWEYSPQFNIRSWMYPALHAAVARIAAVFVKEKVSVFYAIRALFALSSTLTESHLILQTARHFNTRTSAWLLLFLLVSPGMTTAATAYLPSTFSMYLCTLAFSYSLDPRPNVARTAKFVFVVATSVLLGWPFCGAVAVPFVVQDLVVNGTFGNCTRFARLMAAVKAGVLALVVVLGPTVVVDRVFYGRWSVVPVNIVLYNVVGASGGEDGRAKGPDIFGTEPWYFYLLNASLNFNIAFLASLASPVLVLLHRFLPPTTGTPRVSLTHQLFTLAPYFLWLGIFSAQSHKEERFLFVAYPMLCFCAAVACDSAVGVVQSVMQYLGGSKKKTKKMPTTPRWIFVLCGAIASAFTVLSLARITAMYQNYSAPIHIYTAVSRIQADSPSARVCLGKEWHRFPGHYFVPEGVEVRFVESEFRGLLPALFGDSGEGGVKERWEVTRQVPTGLNEFNEQDRSRFVDLETCGFM